MNTECFIDCLLPLPLPLTWLSLLTPPPAPPPPGSSNPIGCLVSQDHILSELQGGMRLIRVALGRKADSLAQLQAAAASSRPPLAPPPSSYMATPTSCKKRGCGNAENQPPEKRTFLAALFPAALFPPACKYGAKGGATMHANQTATPSARILRSRQQSPHPGPAPSTPRSVRGKY